MPSPVQPVHQGLSISQKILIPFLTILIALGLTAAIATVRLISNSFSEHTNSELLAARDIVDREIKEQEALLHIFGDMLASSHFALPGQSSIGATLENLELGEGALSAQLITAQDPLAVKDRNLQRLVTLSQRSGKHQLQVINDSNGVPTITLVRPVNNMPGSYLRINSHLDQKFLREITIPLQVNAQLLSLDNQVLVTTDSNAVPLPALNNQELRQVLSGGLLFKTHQSGVDIRYLFCAVPIGTTELLLLSINRPMAELQRTISSLATHSAAAILVALLIGGYLFFTLVRRVMQPLTNLLVATRELGAGNLEHQVQVTSKDEFGILARSFNAMVSEIKLLYGQKVEQEKSLAQANEGLKYKDILEAQKSEIELTNQELRSHLKELSALFNLNQAMATSLEIDILFDRMIAVLKDLLHCNRIVLFTYNPDTEELVVRKSFGSDSEQLHGTVFQLDEGITGKVAFTQEMHYIPDLVADDRNLNYQGRSRSEGSMISVPLAVKNRLSGVLNLHKFQIYAFTPSELKLVKAIANQAAVAIENSQLYEKARTLSNTDELTGLANRRHFQLILKRELAQAQRFHSHFALIMADLDNFKAYNDTHGHLKGDILLKNVSKVLLQNTRGIDLVARFGGEEFVILLPKTDTGGARSAAEKLRTGILAEQFQGIAESHPGGALTISLGIAAYPNDSRDIYELLDLADRALYRAKEEGKNRVIAWSDNSSEQRTAE